MKVYIINLERSTERRKHIEAEAEKHDLDYEFVKAVDGSELTESDLAEFCDQHAIKTYPDWLTKSAVGCALSHLRAYKQMIADGAEAALILEDDVILPENINDLLTGIAAHLSGNEAVLLYYQSLKKLSLSKVSAAAVNDNFQLLYPMTLEGVTSAAAYIITQKAAQILADFIVPIKFTADSWTCFVSCEFISTVRMVYPRPISTTNAKSTLTVVGQSGLRAKLTTFIDDRKIPFLFHIFRFLRRNSIKNYSRFVLSDDVSPFQK